MEYYLQTKFRGNLKGSSIFCVDLTWNDPMVRFVDFQQLCPLILYVHMSHLFSSCWPPIVLSVSVLDLSFCFIAPIFISYPFTA